MRRNAQALTSPLLTVPCARRLPVPVDTLSRSKTGIPNA